MLFLNDHRGVLIFFNNSVIIKKKIAKSVNFHKKPFWSFKIAKVWNFQPPQKYTVFLLRACRIFDNILFGDKFFTKVYARNIKKYWSAFVEKLRIYSPDWAHSFLNFLLEISLKSLCFGVRSQKALKKKIVTFSAKYFC